MTDAGGASTAGSSSPSVVAIGGGHGLAATLRAVRLYAGSISAVVSVADDGGSSGRLRAVVPDLPAPGDVRRCLSALGDPTVPLTTALEHRFGGDDEIAGHALGNLLLVALTTVVGSFDAAVDELGRTIGAAGRVLPATAVPVTLVGRLAERPDGSGAPVVHGQVAVQSSARIAAVHLEPDDARSPAAVTEAITGADQVVIGPGSLYTSVLAAAVAPEVRDALWKTTGQRVYVANLGPQVPETEGFALVDHVEALLDHDIPVDLVVCPSGTGEPSGRTVLGISVVERPMAAEGRRVHDPTLLAEALHEVLLVP